MWGFGRRLEKVKEGGEVERIMKEEGSPVASGGTEVVGEPGAVVVGGAEEGRGGGKAEYADFEGRRKPVKKWFGIW